MGQNLAYTFVAYNAQNQRYMIIPVVKAVSIFINPSAPTYVYFAASDENQWSVACPTEEEATKLLRAAVLIQAHTHIHGNKDATTETFHIPLRGSEEDPLKPGYKAGITYRAWEFTAGSSDLPQGIVEETPLKECVNSLAKLVVGLKKSSPVAGLEKSLEGLSKSGSYMCFVPPSLNIGDNSLGTISSTSWVCIEVDIKRTKSGVLPPEVVEESVVVPLSSSSLGGGEGDFIASTKWIGSKSGYEFRQGDQGTGYYRSSISSSSSSNSVTKSQEVIKPKETKNEHEEEQQNTTASRPRRRSSGRKPKFGRAVLPMPGMTNNKKSSPKKRTSSSSQDLQQQRELVQEQRQQEPTQKNYEDSSKNEQIVPYEKSPEKKKEVHQNTTTTTTAAMYSSPSPAMMTAQIHHPSVQHIQMTCQAMERQLSTVARDVVSILETQRQLQSSSLGLQSQSNNGQYNHLADRGYPYGKNRVSSEALLDGLTDVMTQNKEFRDKIKKQDEKIDGLEAKEKELQSELMAKMNESSKMLRESLQASQNLFAMQQKMNPLNREIETLRKENEMLKLKVSTNTGNGEDDKKEIVRLKNALSEATKNADETQISLNTTREVSEKLRSEIEKLQSEISVIKSSRDELEKELCDVKKKKAEENEEKKKESEENVETKKEEEEEEEKKKKTKDTTTNEDTSKLQEEIERLKNVIKHSEEKLRVEKNVAVQKAIKSAMTQVYTQLQGPFAKIEKGNDEFKLKAVIQIPKMVAKVIRKVTKKVTAVHNIPNPHPPPPKKE